MVVEGLEQDGPAIRTRVRLVEAAHHRLAQPLELEGHLRYTLCSPRASSRVCNATSNHRFYSTFEGLGGSFVSSFTSYPG